MILFIIIISVSTANRFLNAFSFLCSVAKLCLFPSGTMCTICGWGQKTNKAISLLINNIALFNLLKDVYLCGRSVILCGHFTDFAFRWLFR